MKDALGRRLGVIILSAALGFAARPASADPVNLRVAWATTPSVLTPLFAVLAQSHAEIFSHLGKTYTFEPVHSTGSPMQITALAAGELEIGSLGPSSLALAITNAHLDLRVIGGVLEDGMAGQFKAYFTVKKDGPVQRIEDMKGRRAAINAVGSPVWMELHVVLARRGLTDKDYVTIEGAFPNMFALIESDKVDTVPVINPVMAHAFDVAGRYRPLFVISDELGPSQAEMWTVRADFIAAHRAALVDYLEDMIRGERWFLDPRNHEAAIDIVQGVTKEPRETVDYAFTGRDVGRSVDFMPDVPAIQHEIDQALELKLLPQPVTVDPDYLDLSLVKEAKQRLDGKQAH